jgi:hypothetical protein
VSHQRPIFNTGLFGRANASVCNAWTDAADAVSQNADGIAWASEQVVRGSVPETWLAKLTSAVSLGTNRWKYVFEPMTISLATNAATPQQLLAGTFGKTPAGPTHEQHAFNIRELRNTAAEIDGTVLATGQTIGPVGSTWTNLGGGAAGWSLVNLAGYVLLHQEYSAEGLSLFWFDCVNPTRCDPQANFIGGE